MIDIDPQIQQDSEPEGYEFGYYTFDTLPAAEISNVDMTQETTGNDKSGSDENHIELPLDNNILFEVLQKDAFCVKRLTQIEKGNIIEGQIYKVQKQTVEKICN